MIIGSGYLDHVFNPEKLKQVVKLARKKMRQIHKAHPFDTIAFTGVSGAALGFILSYDTGFPVLVVRKSGESSHASYKVEGNHSVKRYLVVDDFIDEGNTIRRIVKRIDEELTSNAAVCAAIMLYAPTSGNAYITDGESAKKVTPRLPDVPIYSLDW